MSSWINRNFDIDLWIKLALENPFKFETQRHQWLEDSIEMADDVQKPRLRGILWEINMDIEIAKNKLNSCRSIARRLVDHLEQFKELLSGNMPFINQHPARILPFMPRSNGDLA